MGVRKNIWVQTILCLSVFYVNHSLFAQDKNQEIEARIDSLNVFDFQYITSNPAEAESLYATNLERARSINYQKGIADSYSRLALASNYLGKYEQDISYTLNAIELYERLNLMYDAGYAYAELGYRVRKRSYERAEFFMRKGINILGNFENSINQANAFNNYGMVKLEQEQTDSALYFIQRSLEIKKLNNDSLGIAYSYSYLGNVYMQLDEFDEAIDYISKGYDIRKMISDSSGMAIDLYNIGYSYFRKNDVPRAASTLKASLELSLAIDYSRLAEENYSTLASMYEQQKDYEQALTYRKEYSRVRQERINESKNNRLAELEVEFETEQKEKELALKSAALGQEQLKVRQKNWILGTLGGLFVAGLFVAGLLYRQQKIKQDNLKRENKLRIQLANAEMENKIHQERDRISRDLHDNVGAQITNLIAGIEISNLHIQKNQQDEAIQILSTLDEDARSAMNELRETIWLLEKESVSFKTFHHHISNYLNTQAQYLGGMKANISSTIEEKIVLNPTQSLNLMRIVQESINNSRKYAEASLFKIDCSFSKNRLNIQISDNGKGMEVLENQSKGNGIRNMTHRANDLDAEIEINSKPDKGTTIYLKIPIIP